VITLESLFTNRKAFAIETATPVQIAACRAADGRPLGDLWDNPDVRAAFGGVKPPEKAPFEFLLLAAERSAKSIFVSAGAVRASQNCDVSKLKPGDVPRIPVVSTDKDAAEATFNHIANNVTQRPALRALLVGNPKTDTVVLRHPSGIPVEIKVVALARYASTLVSRWFASVIFDEATRMSGESDGVKNLGEARLAVQARILPGGQLFDVGSPYAPQGPIYDLVQEHHGKPTEEICVVRAPGPMMNPGHYTPQFCERLRQRNPVSYRINVLCEFTDPEEAFFASVEVDKNVRELPLRRPAEQRFQYVATMDPATRGNSWTLMVGSCAGYGGPGGVMPRYRIDVATQWTGSKAAPLNVDLVFQEMAEILLPYGVSVVITDQYAVDALAVTAERHGITLQSQTYDTEKFVKMCDTIKLLLGAECLELPPDRQVRADLIAARKRVTLSGYRVVLPRTGDGRHADYVPALALFAANPPGPPLDEPERVDPRLLRAREDIASRQGGDAWDSLGRRMAS
jgi:hypothetical protein